MTLFSIACLLSHWCDNQEEASPQEFLGCPLFSQHFYLGIFKIWSGWSKLRNVTVHCLVNCMSSIRRVMMHSSTQFLVATISFMFIFSQLLSRSMCLVCDLLTEIT